MPQVAPATLTERDRARLALLGEKGDDHFYGAWKGGRASQGGGPADSAEGKAVAAEGKYKDHAELVSAMEAKWGGDWSEMSKVPLPLANCAAVQIDETFTRFGSSPNFKGVRVPDHGPSGVIAEVKRVNPAEKGSAVYLYGNYWGKESRMDGLYAAQLKDPKGNLMGTAGSRNAMAMGIVQHELGHQYMGLNLHSRLGADRNAAVRKELEPWFHNTFLPNIKTAHVSKYARKNPHEAWAELFAAATGHGKTESHFVPELRTILDKHYPPASVTEAAVEEASKKVLPIDDGPMPAPWCGWAHQHPEIGETPAPEPITEADHERLRFIEKGEDHFYGAWKGGSKGAGGGPEPTVKPAAAVSALAKGERPSVKPEDVEATLEAAAGHDGVLDLTELKVAGTLKFGGDGLGMTRTTMPQVPSARLPDFLDHLRAGGATVAPGKVNPQDIKPAQKEVNAAKSAAMLKTIRSEGSKKPVLISRDNYVIDGHHQWGASTALSFSDPAYRMPVLRVDMDAKPLIAATREWTQAQGIATKALGESEVKGFALVESITQEGGMFVIRSADGSKVLGRYASRAAAEKRLAQIEMFKHMKERDVLTSTEMEMLASLEPLALTDDERALLAEKSGDDHFYGAWRGGKASQGGGPASQDTMAMHTDENGKWSAKRAMRVHEPYIRTTGKGIPVVAEPTVYMTGGGTASGKTSALLKNPETGIPGKDKAAHIDPDSAKGHIPEYRQQVTRGDKTAAALAHEESSYMSKAALAANLRAGHHVVFDTTGDSGAKKIGNKIAQMRAAGAKRIEGHYASCDVKTAIARSDARAKETGRYVSHNVIRQLHRDVTRTSLEGMVHFDHMTFFDTNGKAPVRMATYDKGKGLTVHNKDMWSRYVAKGQYGPGEMPTLQMAEAGYAPETGVEISEAPKNEDEEAAFTGWDVDSDELSQIITDIAMGRSIKDSRWKYTAAMKTARAEIEDEWDAYRRTNPNAILDIPSELPRADIDVSDAPNPWAKEKTMEEVAALPLTDRDRERLALLEKGDDHFYGAWKGGSAKSGGGPAGAAKGNKGPALVDERETLKFLGPAGEMKDGVLHIAGRPATPAEIERLNNQVEMVRKDLAAKAEQAAMGDAFARGLSKGGLPAKGGPQSPAAVRAAKRRAELKAQAAHAKSIEDRNVAEYKLAVAGRQDKWVIGGGGKETPFTRNGTRYVAVFNPKTGEHGFLDMGRDMVVNDKDFYREAAMLAEKDALPITDEEREFFAYVAAHPEDYDFGDLTEAERAAVGLAEKSGDDHFYGAWKGGSKGAGGGPEGRDVVSKPAGAPGSPEREKDVDAKMASLRTGWLANANDHVEIRMANGDLVSGRLSGRQPGEVEVRQFKQGLGFASVPVATKDVSHVRVSGKPWVNTDSPTGWVRYGSPEHKAAGKNVLPHGVGRHEVAATPTLGRLSSGKAITPKKTAPKLPPKGKSVLDKPRTPSPFRMGYHASGMPRKPSGS